MASRRRFISWRTANFSIFKEADFILRFQDNCRVKFVRLKLSFLTGLSREGRAKLTETRKGEAYTLRKKHINFG
tara:strand:+ start:87 stop:308 length:222 start_codon:yes stop_codon:yes gene_type:complete